ncbi:MAG: inositol monophosphatase family protein [Solirubrobacterales bacterium]
MSAPATDRDRLGDLCLELARDLRETVLPELGSVRGRDHHGTAPGGDVTFAVDEQAEQRLAEFLAERAPDVAFYSEDRGLVLPDDTHEARWVLIVDPIDGTRPAMAGFEAACVAVAAAPMEGTPTIGSTEIGVIIEIKTGAEFVAVRGKGVTPAPALSQTVDLRRLFLVYGLRGRPARETIEVLAELIDGASVGGSTFDLGSASYDLTRILTGQLDAYVEPGPRLVSEVPGMRERFEEIGNGAILNNTPYDLAAAVLILREGGAIVTDATGAPLDDRALLGSGPEFQMSCVAASSAELHSRVLNAVEAGMARVRDAA